MSIPSAMFYSTDVAEWYKETAVADLELKLINKCWFVVICSDRYKFYKLIIEVYKNVWYFADFNII